MRSQGGQGIQQTLADCRHVAQAGRHSGQWAGMQPTQGELETHAMKQGLFARSGEDSSTLWRRCLYPLYRHRDCRTDCKNHGPPPPARIAEAGMTEVGMARPPRPESATRHAREQ